MRRSIAAVAVLAVALAGCEFALVAPPPGQPPQPPTEGQARAHLAKVVAVVAIGDLSKLCELATPTCEMDLRNLDPALVPSEPPLVVGGRTIVPTQRGEGAWDIGGYVLQLCGIDGAGVPYDSQMLVFQDGDHLISINTLYWLGMGIGGGQITGEVGQPACP